MKCLVTGSAGFIGSHLCERLIADGHLVRGVDDLSTGSRTNLHQILNHQRFHFIHEKTGQLSFEDIAEMDWVFHLSGRADIVPSIENPMEYHNANVTETVHLLQLSRMAKIKRFLYAASSSCYGIPKTYPTPEIEEIKPQYPYALTKWMGEKYALHWASVYGLELVSLRLFNVFGPRHRTSGAYGAVFGTFMAQLANHQPVTIVGDGTQTRDFTYVTDVVEAFVAAAKSTYVDVFNVGTGKPQTVNYLAYLLGAKETMHIPNRPGEPATTCADTTKIQQCLRWRPKVLFEEGVEIMKALIPQYKDAPLWTPEKIAKATESWFKYLS